MCDTTFAFGQRGGYYFESPSQWQFAELPSGLRSLFAAKKVAATYCVELGADKSWLAAYRDKEGTDRIVAEGLPKPLMDWIYEKDGEGYAKRNIKSLYVTLGPYNKSYYATDETAQQWLNVPSGLKEALEQRRKPGGGWTFPPKIVALGVGGDFVFTTAGGGYSYVLSNYKSLDACFKTLVERSDNLNAVHRVTLNAYRMQCYMLQSENGIVISGSMPPHAESAVAAITEAIKSDTEQKIKRDIEAQRLEQMQQARDEELRQLRELNQLAAARQAAEYAALQQQINQMKQLNAAMTGMAIGTSIADVILAGQAMNNWSYF